MIVLLQARMSSSRLPGKALLPIGGFPGVVLAAKRAGNRGAKVRVITSNDPSDDMLATILVSHGLDIFRGDLDDVLARTVSATEGLPDDTVAVRLTGDNMFPDQSLIDAVATTLSEKNLDYAGIQWPDDGLPYGLSVEAFRLGALRAAHRETSCSFDREHTTPWLRRHCRSGNWPQMAHLDMARLRCTIDSFDDYLSMLRVFEEISDPIQVPWMELTRMLAKRPDAPPGLVPSLSYWGTPGNDLAASRISRVVVDATATAQVAGSAASRRLRAAIDCGVSHLLVSSGDSHANALAGQALSHGWSGRAGVIGVLQIEERQCDGLVIERATLRLCNDLGLRSLDALLLPSGLGPEAWASAQGLKSQGIVRRVGLWHLGADPNEGLAELVLNRQPPASEVPALGMDSHAVHRVAILTEDTVWPTLVRAASSGMSAETNVGAS